MKLQRAATLLFVLLSGCVTVRSMGVRSDSDSVDTSAKSLLLLTVVLSQKDNTYYVPEAKMVKLARPNPKRVDDRRHFEVDHDGTIESEGKRTYYLRMALEPGKYSLNHIWGDAGRFPIHGFFNLPLLMDIDVPANAAIYIGRVDAVLRPREGGEFRAGSVVPLFDQYVTGVSEGTFDVVVSDQSVADVAAFRRMFPALMTVDIRTVLLPAFDRPKVQTWWEGS